MTTLRRFPSPLSNWELDALRQKTTVWHAGQTYGDIEPYTNHLDDVRRVLSRFGFNLSDFPHLHMIAELHDVLEDQPDRVNPGLLIGLNIPSYVVASVEAITDEPGANRKERKQLTYLKLRRNRDALIVKVADRIANVERGGKTDMYRKEHNAFRQFLFFENDLPLRDMWAYLDGLLAG